MALILSLLTSDPMTAIGRPDNRGDSDPSTVLAKAVRSAAGRLRIRDRELAAILGSSESSVSRLKHGRRLDPASREGGLALLFLRLYWRLDVLVGGDDNKARAWLHSENDHLVGVPAEWIRTVEGLVDVVRYLDAVGVPLRGRTSQNLSPSVV